MSEILSSLVDGEAKLSQTDIENIKNNPEMAKKWQNYHLIKDVIQDTVPAALPQDFSKRVMHAIAQEPVVLAPRPKLAKKAWLRPAAGFAVAATVALATIGGMQTVWQPNDEAGQQPVQVTQLAPSSQPVLQQSSPFNIANTSNRTAANIQPVSVTRASGIPVTNAYNQSYSNNLHWKRSAPTDVAANEEANKKMAEELNQLLMHHMRSAGAIGVLPYARLAGYDDN